MDEDIRERKKELEKKKKLNDTEVKEYLDILNMEENEEENELEETMAEADNEEIENLGRLFHDDVNISTIEVNDNSSDSEGGEIDLEMEMMPPPEPAGQQEQTKIYLGKNGMEWHSAPPIHRRAGRADIIHLYFIYIIFTLFI